MSKNQGYNPSVLMVARYLEPKYVGSSRAIHLKKLLDLQGVVSNTFSGRNLGPLRMFSLRTFFRCFFGRESVVFVSCGPFDYLIPVILGARFSGKKIIIDFRDPWSFNIQRKSIRGKISFLIAQLAERFSYFFCTGFIVCTPGMMSLYKTLFQDSSKLRLVMNGFNFDPDEIVNFRDEPENRKERFVCMGKFFYYSLEKAINVIELLERRGSQLNKDIELALIGDERDLLLNNNSLFLGLYHVKIKTIGRLQYMDTLEYASTSTGAVVIIRNEDFDFGTKIFDCIGLGLPVLDSFDRSKIFYKTFKNFLLPFDAVFTRFKPDLKYHRDAQWLVCLDWLTFLIKGR